MEGGTGEIGSWTKTRTWRGQKVIFENLCPLKGQSWADLNYYHNDSQGSNHIVK
jgi:hypothetical protein